MRDGCGQCSFAETWRWKDSKRPDSMREIFSTSGRRFVQLIHGNVINKQIRNGKIGDLEAVFLTRTVVPFTAVEDAQADGQK